MVVDKPGQDHNNVHRVGHPGGGAQTGLPPHTLPGKVSANLIWGHSQMTSVERGREGVAQILTH